MISVESVITLLLLLVHQSMLDKLSPDFNAGGINTTREHPHNDSSSYQNNSLTGNYRDELQVGRSPTSGDINSKAISSERKNITVEQSHDHLYFEEQNEKHIPELLSGILPNSSSENKLQVNNGTTSTGISKNQTVELELKPQKNLTNKKKCHFCNNDTKKDIQSSYQLFNNSEKSDQLDQLISSTVIPNKEPTINFSREDISLLPHVQTTTISGITVKDAEVVKTDAFNDNKIFHSQNVTVQPESHPKMRSNVSSNSSNQRFTSPSAGFRTSTMSVELSSILLQVNSDRETKKQKISLVPEADIPNFSNSNGYPPHAIHGLIWEDRRYLLSVLIPVGCGILGALTMVSLAYVARNCRSRYSYHPSSTSAAPEEVAYMDKIVLIPDSSDDEV